ncbi:hypothetical protein [Nocardioides antri]|uniref:Uncharacterized protein n=1 Tax=Nocardioides antri TaxID=2607659 RepID=A0A5B1M3X8_9ACTN|nr:hypothetical protein [Nocardioides antri]KAA1426467.1 hypothetical protein F0U47_13780 [Nocardioides antri]
MSAGEYYAEKAEGEEAGGWVPAFPGQRPPFAPGNEVADMRWQDSHGAYSPRKVDPLAKELVDLVLADPSTAYLQAGHWRPALYAWARAEAQVQLVSEWLADQATEKHPIGDLGDERVRAAYLLLHRAETRATTGRTRLGLDPLSAARLGRDKTAAALDAAQLMAQLERQEREREERRG